MLELLENARIAGNTPTFAPKARRSVCFSSHQPSRRRREGRLLTHDHPHCLVFQIYCVYVLYMYLLDVSIRDLKYFCVLFVLFVFLFMLLALLRCYTSIYDGFIVTYCYLLIIDQRARVVLWQRSVADLIELVRIKWVGVETCNRPGGRVNIYRRYTVPGTVYLQ